MPMEPIVLVSAKDMVTEKLRQEIYIGNLKPGEELVQEKISEQLGVSRMPVREALLLLESAGLIEFQKNKRAIVKSVTPESIAEHLEIRAILESHAVRKACQRAKNFDRLARIMRKFEDCGSEDAERFRDLNTRFHFEIWRLAESPQLQRMLEQLWYQIPSAYPLDRAKNFHRNMEEHTAIFDALVRQDANCAADMLARHISGTRDIVITRLHQQKDDRLPEDS